MYKKKYFNKIVATVILSIILQSSVCFAADASTDPLLNETSVETISSNENSQSETSVPETSAPETSAPETSAPETSAPETSAPETSAPETSTPETSAPETSAPETSTPETSAPETSSPETSAPETSSPETSAPETSAPETSAPETSVPETSTPETSEPETADSEISTEMPTESSIETEPSSESANNEKDTEKKETEGEEPESTEEHNSPYSTNSALIAAQNIVSPQRMEDFRFTTVSADRVIIRAGAAVYEKKDSSSRIVGSVDEASYGYILQDDADGWCYIETGNVRGFVSNTDIIEGSVVEAIIGRDGIWSFADMLELVSYYDNAAFTYTKTTTQDVVVSKKYALSKFGEISVYEENCLSGSRVVGVIPKDGISYILEDCGNDIIYVESGNVRGFARKSAFYTGSEASKMVKEHNEAYYSLGEENIPVEENKACYYTLTSVQEANDVSYKRKSIVDFALQFVGNPYVWGGTSLTNGADCSGFVQTIYSYYGYYLPRVACDQACYGTQIPISEAQPGDLIFYAKNGYVYHVSMYIGNGEVVHAYSTNAGIITSGIGSSAVWATSILD